MVAALLHDVIDDTTVDLESIQVGNAVFIVCVDMHLPQSARIPVGSGGLSLCFRLQVAFISFLCVLGVQSLVDIHTRIHTHTQHTHTHTKTHTNTHTHTLVLTVKNAGILCAVCCVLFRSAHASKLNADMQLCLQFGVLSEFICW
jgi:hypothetical protein